MINQILNFERGPRVPLLNFEGGPTVPLLNFKSGKMLQMKLMSFYKYIPWQAEQVPGWIELYLKSATFFGV